MTHPSLQTHSYAKSIVARLVLAFALAPSSTLGAATTGRSTPASLTVTFQGLKTVSGTVRVSLSRDPEGFAGKATAADQAAITVTGPTATATFVGLKPGTYAIRAFHDLNGDGKLNANAFGIPIEPYAFSNNAHGSMGPPSWSAAAFQVRSGANGQTIDID